ncbi:hypothetical protein SAMN06269185_1043 [Natronoarchaeum philippinense]|uniref:Uncharacterized protein n=1 Tax=Natronoarchaeum philippinense TaxID=558529 RepID=A0A285N9J2_NATPI|nr:hypothetical protein [Natronoarchaeum philippinense]SNZ06090.1 hypothetical protein SAMN06269185_1043 [Natronoarchaeum philippinense]
MSIDSDFDVSAEHTIDPLVCPRGHHAIRISRNTVSCVTCRDQRREQSSWDRSEVVDLRNEDPPLKDDNEVLPDGGTVENGADYPTCDHREHRGECVPAVAQFEGLEPPAGPVFRYWACAEHEPDAPALKRIDPEEADQGDQS